MNTISKLTLATALSLAFATAALATAAEPAAQLPASAAATTSKSEGEIKKIDKAAGKVTIKHGELKNLKMPPMTMVFRVKDSAKLDQIKAGDKIQFVDGKAEGLFTATEIVVKK
jgi:Cu(I)/Ag(I) efflux system periplasmic protein CusF